MAERAPEWREQLPLFVAEIKQLFSPGEIRGYLDGVRQVGPLGHVLSDDEFEEFRAAGAVLYGENRKKIPRTQRDLANLIVECAYDLGLAPDDMLNANEKNVLVAAQELLAGMRAADLDADS